MIYWAANLSDSSIKKYFGYSNGQKMLDAIYKRENISATGTYSGITKSYNSVRNNYT